MRNILRLTLLALCTLVHSVRALGSDEPTSSRESASTPIPKSGPDVFSSAAPMHTVLEQKIKKIETGTTTASTSMELIDAWQGALQAAHVITQEAKNRKIESFGKHDREIEMLNDSTPWGYLTFYAEGQQPRFELQLEYWTDLANKLPDNHAKAFFELAQIAYDNASFSGWSNIHQRTWDYGGCSPLGTDLHLNILTKIDAIRADPMFASRVETVLSRVRELAMTDLLIGTAEFPYCNRTDSEQQKKMVEEVREILETRGLSEAERNTLKARLLSNMGL